jgi:hypothetical protein
MPHQLKPDRVYYAERALAELAAAEAATSPEARSIHLHLADRYSAIVAEMDHLIGELSRDQIQVLN